LCELVDADSRGVLLIRTELLLGSTHSSNIIPRETKRHLEESGAESDAPDDVGGGGQSNDGSEDGRGIAGWLGTPDPRKYAAGTNHLSPQELEQETKAGNIVAFSDLNESIKQLQPWEQKMLFYEVLADYTKNR
jgi:hypothetical protein